MTWNLQGRVGDWHARERAVVHHLRAQLPDVVMLQESWVENNGTTQAAVLADELELFAVTAEALAGFDRYPGAPYWVVNAIMSRWPLRILAAVPLPDEHGEPTWRHVLIAEVDRPAALGGPFRVAGCHLEHAQQRREQPPIVLGGDLNAVPWSDEIRRLTGAASPEVDGFVLVDAWEAAGGIGRGDTWSSENPRVPARAVYPNRRLDYVMVSWPRARGLGHVSSCTIAGTDPVDGVWASDHFAVCAEVDL